MFGKLMNSYYYGKSGKGDFQKEDLPHNRWQLFWAMLRVRLGGLSRMNLMVLVVYIPLMGVLLVNGLRYMQALTLASGYHQYLTEGTELGEEYTDQVIAVLQSPPYFEDGAFDLLRYGRDVFSFTLFHTLLWLIPCILITGPVEAGMAYVCRNWARDEHAFVWADFRDAVKENWKQALGVSVITALIPLIMYLCWQFYGSLAENNALFMVPQMLILVLGILWFLGLIFMYPLMVTYKMTFFQLIKNALILSVGRLPQTVGIRLVTLFPAALCLFLFMFTGVGMYGILALGIYYIVMGIALHRFIFASFTNAVFDRFINSRMEGVQINRGLSLEEDEEEEEEDEEQPQEEGEDEEESGHLPKGAEAQHA